MKPTPIELGYIASDADDHKLNDNSNFVEFFNPNDAATMQAALEFSKTNFKVVHKNYEQATHSRHGQKAIRFFVAPEENTLRQGIELNKLYEFVKDLVKNGDRRTKEHVTILSQQYERVFINI